MKNKEKELREAEALQLRVFRGEEDGENQAPEPPDPTQQQREEWLQKEAFWAGRNRAGRISVRLVA